MLFVWCFQMFILLFVSSTTYSTLYFTNAVHFADRRVPPQSNYFLPLQSFSAVLKETPQLCELAPWGRGIIVTTAIDPSRITCITGRNI